MDEYVHTGGEGCWGRGRWAGASNLVEERQGLVGWQLDGCAQRGDVVLLQAQAEQDSGLQVGEVGRDVAAEVGLGQRRQQVQDDVMVHQVVGVCLSSAHVALVSTKGISARGCMRVKKG